jgi:hypothetical protein
MGIDSNYGTYKPRDDRRDMITDIVVFVIIWLFVGSMLGGSESDYD